MPKQTTSNITVQRMVFLQVNYLFPVCPLPDYTIGLHLSEETVSQATVTKYVDIFNIIYIHMCTHIHTQTPSPQNGD